MQCHKNLSLLKIFIFASVLCLLVIGCKQTTSSSYDKDQINQILYNVRLAYEQNDIDGVMQYYHTSFLHNGQSLWQIREVWQNRRSEYPLLEMQNVSIKIEADEAVVSFTMKLIKPGQIVYSNEPADNGDLSYYLYDNEKWQIWGNQQSK